MCFIPLRGGCLLEVIAARLATNMGMMHCEYEARRDRSSWLHAMGTRNAVIISGIADGM